ncbi:MAG: hypothetical protein ACFCD0_27335 [Gemmataceae bacterium]
MAQEINEKKRTFTDEILSKDMAAILRTKTPAERLAIAFRMWSFARKMIRQTAEVQHPEWTDAELDRHVARRMSHGAV